jgi:ribosome-associated protein
MSNKSPVVTSSFEAQIPAGHRSVEIAREPVELYKILKFEGLADSGGHAKAAVAAGEVWVNGKVELQKRKKILSGDTIEFAGDSIRIKLALFS